MKSWNNTSLKTIGMQIEICRGCHVFLVRLHLSFFKSRSRRSTPRFFTDISKKVQFALKPNSTSWWFSLAGGGTFWKLSRRSCSKICFIHDCSLHVLESLWKMQWLRKRYHFLLGAIQTLMQHRNNKFLTHVSAPQPFQEVTNDPSNRKPMKRKGHGWKHWGGPQSTPDI